MIPMKLIALQVSRRPPGMCIYITRIIIGVHEFLFSKRFKALYSEYKSVPCLPARTRDRTLGSRNSPKAPASPCSGRPSPSFVATSSLRFLLTDFLCARPPTRNQLWIRSTLAWKRRALRTCRCLLRHIPELEPDYPAAVLHLGSRYIFLLAPAVLVTSCLSEVGEVRCPLHVLCFISLPQTR